MDTETARAIPPTYEIWGETRGNGLVAVRRSGETITGLHSNRGRVLSAGQANQLDQLKYEPALPRGVHNFNTAVAEGRLARIR